MNDLLLTASHSFRSSPLGKTTALRMLPLPRVALANSDSLCRVLLGGCTLSGLNVLFLLLLLRQPTLAPVTTRNEHKTRHITQDSCSPSEIRVVDHPKSKSIAEKGRKQGRKTPTTSTQGLTRGSSACWAMGRVPYHQTRGKAGNSNLVRLRCSKPTPKRQTHRCASPSKSRVSLCVSLFFLLFSVSTFSIFRNSNFGWCPSFPLKPFCSLIVICTYVIVTHLYFKRA